MATRMVQARLVNEPFSDAGLLLDFRFGSRAMLFDLGDLSALSPREIVRASHVFVSHMHMDHFSGFDYLLRLRLYRPGTLHLLGPAGLAAAVDAKLRAYTWNLLDEESADFAVEASDWDGERISHRALFRARKAFARQELMPPEMPGGLVLDEPEFHVEAAALDHGIASLAFAFQERLRVNVDKARLDALGLRVGPWLTEAKRAVRSACPPETLVEPGPGRSISLAELLVEGVLMTKPGLRVVYATDLAFVPHNVSRVVELARGADELFIEAGFLEEDSGLARSKMHLTAAQAGHIAAQAGVRRAVPMHFSPRYVTREDELRAEFEAGLAAAR